MKEWTIDELIEHDIVFMGSDWVEDASATDSALPGYRYRGEKPCVNCNDAFFWACADAEDIDEKTMPAFNQAVHDCAGDLSSGALLYCSRIRQQRPQGAMYSYIPESLWTLFNACGPERETGIGNPCRPGEYRKPTAQRPSLWRRIKKWYSEDSGA